MLWALFVVGCWAIASVAASRAAAHADGVPASRVRLALALALLAALTWRFGGLSWQAGGWWFLASGVLGLALGDTALFAAYDRLGARLPALIAYALAAPLAGAVEWAWLGTAIAPRDAALAGILLVGVALALGGRPDEGKGARSSGSGVLLAVLAAIGFALSAVAIREGHRHWQEAEGPLRGIDIALVRGGGGMLASLALWPLLPRQDSLGYWTRRFERRQGARSWTRAAPWLAISALAGPVAGVVFYQRALAEAPSALVQAVVALVPVAVVPLAWLTEGDRPSGRTLFGAGLAAASAAALAISRLG
jgi:drug/metabolite transporter (DMT)-like permease